MREYINGAIIQEDFNMEEYIKVTGGGEQSPPLSLAASLKTRYLALAGTARSLRKCAVSGNCFIYRYFARSDKITGQPQLDDCVIRQSENFRRQDPGFRNGP